ncbi:MAG: DUF1566 domain-containing protein [Deltaproteobacteria bacterium]|nr:DUF1566 domain-containing protein [Deltaproteobacteria bacterium]
MLSRTLVAMLALVSILTAIVAGCGDDDDDRASFGGDDDDDSGVPVDDDDDTGDDDDDDDSTDDDDSGYELMLYRDTPIFKKKHDQAEAFCADLEFDGYDDWRLPTISELRSIIRGCPAAETGGSCGVTDDCAESDCWTMDDCEACKMFPNEGPGSEGGYCDLYSWFPFGEVWSSTEVEDDSEIRSFWQVEFNDAGIHPMAESYDRNTWCVRWGEVTDDDTDDGTWTDENTDLTWEVEPSGEETGWEEAQDHCESLSEGWRLPTISELRSLITICEATMTGGSCLITDECTDSESCNPPECWQGCDGYGGQALGCYWPADLRGSCEQFWSATETTPVTTQAWTIHFRDATILRDSKEVLNPIRVRCVRDAK